MVRVTQAQTIQNENEGNAFEFFRSVLSAIPDPRRRQGKRYPFETVVVIALMATICFAEDAQAMESWGEIHRDWLETFLEMPHGPPTQDVFLSVLGNLDPKRFEELLVAWAKLLSSRLQGQQIALDGKTSRRSFDPTNGKSAIHTLNAWAVESGLVIGQRTVDSKTNEITAIPEFLKILDIRGATVTADALNCQTAIATAIKEGGGEYLLSVKENQPTLHHDVETTFKFVEQSREKPILDLPAPIVEEANTLEKGHGRLEERCIKLCRDLSWLSNPDKWSDLNYFASVTRRRENLSTGKVSTETAYYIGSDSSADASQILSRIRRHWAVENECHWVLDQAFREDEARHRAKNVGQNMAAIRKFALNIIKQDKNRKLGVANTRKIAGWDDNYLLKLLTQSGC